MYDTGEHHPVELYFRKSKVCQLRIDICNGILKSTWKGSGQWDVSESTPPELAVLLGTMLSPPRRLACAPHFQAPQVLSCCRPAGSPANCEGSILGLVDELVADFIRSSPWISVGNHHLGRLMLVQLSNFSWPIFFALWWILDASEPAASNWVSSRGLMPKTLNHSPNLLIWFWKKDAVRCSHFLKRCRKRAATTSQQLVWLVWIKSGCQVVTATACDTYGMFSTVLNELRWQLKLHTLVTCLDFGAELSFTWAKASPAARQDRFTMDHHGSHHPRVSRCLF